MHAVAFLAEVVEGSPGPGPEALADQLRRGLEEFSREHPVSVRVPPAVPGRIPECAGVLLDLAAAYHLARTLAEHFFPHPVRAAAVWGEFPGPLPEGDPGDAPVFESAAELLYRARKEDRLLFVHGEDPRVDRLANALFLVLQRAMESWTERQCEAVRLYRRLERQEAVAEELGVSQQAVSSSLTAAGWRALFEAESALRDVLTRRSGPG